MMVFPLSYQQQKLYIYSRVHENDAEYNVNQGIELNMLIDCERLEKTVKRILIEEPILRCKIIEKDYKPVQYISDISEYAIEYKKIADEEAEDEIHTLETKLFDVEGDNLFQIHVLQLDSGKNIILFRLHHIICDGWSLQLLMKKFLTYYFENVDEAVIVPEYTYYDYAREQVEQKESEVYQKRNAFWDSVMQENESELELPYDFPKPKTFTREGKRILNFISKEESEQLNQYCKQIGITPFSFLLSVYGDLFSRYSREKKICIAVPVANRFKKKVMESVGYFVNTVPVSIDFTERLTVEDRLKAQHKSFTKMIAKSDVDIECPCNVMFVFQSRPDVQQKDYEKEIHLLRLNNKKSKYELSLSVTYEEGRYGFEWEFMTELFEEQSIQNMNRYLLQMIRGYLANKETISNRISMLSEEEIQIQKTEWNQTEEVFSEITNLKQLLETSVEKHEDVPALVFEGESLTYREFNQYANALCAKLVDSGVKKGQVVPILFYRSFEMVIAIHAIIKLGCAYLPLDDKMPHERMKFVVDDSGTNIILTSAILADKVTGMKEVMIVDRNALSGEEKNPDVQIDAGDNAYVIYTSGSTGNPKGVVNVQEGIVNRLYWMQKQFPLGEGMRVLQKTPYTFDVSVWELSWPLLTGATMVIAKPEGHKNPEYIVDIINSEKVDVVHFVPSMLKKFLSVEECCTCNSLQYVICSGEALEAETSADFGSKLGAQLANLYGPTEAAIDVSCYIVQPDKIGKSIPIGKPISNIKLYKLNDELMFEPPEIPGELYISGIGLAKGYLNNEQKTKETFLACPWRNDKPYERIYKTGDLVTIDKDANIIYLSRKDFQVKIRGQRIELSEIEGRIREVEFVDDAIILVKKKNDGQQVLVAFVKAREKNKDKIIAYIGKYLMEYMIPKVFCFVDEIPVNANGKVDRKRLEKYPIQFEDKEEYLPPEDEWQQIVADAVAHVLSLDRVSKNADFYALGGTSLSFYDVKIEIEKKLNTKIPFEVLMGKSIVSELAECLANYQNSNTITQRVQIDIQEQIKEFTNIDVDNRPVNPDMKQVLLTGATGFLGAFLVRDYLEDSLVELSCLVRADSMEDGYKRIQKNLEKWGLWKENYKDRIHVLCGNLADENLGLDESDSKTLSETIDLICHNGANVNFSIPYSHIKNTNVNGTKQVIKLLREGKRKKLVYVSTISIFAKEDYEQGTIMENRLPGDVNQLKLGYAQSKCVSEYILNELRKKNYDIDIFRIGRIAGSISGGPENEDMFFKMVALCKQMKLYPDIVMNLNCIPVDAVSKIVTYGSLHKTLGKTYHVVNPEVNNAIPLSELFTDGEIKETTWEEWYQTCMDLVDSKDILAKQVFVSLSREQGEAKVELDLSNMKQLLEEMEIKIPKIKDIVIGIINN